MLKVVFLGVAIDENVIKVDHKELSHVRTEDFCHKTHEGAWAFESPNGITSHSYNPSLVLKAVFHSSLGRIRTWW